MIDRTDIYVDGKWLRTDGDRIPVENPATGEQIGAVAEGSAHDVEPKRRAAPAQVGKRSVNSASAVSSC